MNCSDLKKTNCDLINFADSLFFISDKENGYWNLYRWVKHILTSFYSEFSVNQFDIKSLM